MRCITKGNLHTLLSTLHCAKREARKRPSITHNNNTNNEEELDFSQFSNNNNFFTGLASQNDNNNSINNNNEKVSPSLPCQSSLDKVRAEIAVLQQMKKEKERTQPLQKKEENEKQELKQNRLYPPSIQPFKNNNNQNTMSNLYKTLFRTLKENHQISSVYYNGKEVKEGMKINQNFLRQEILNECEDVLRCKNKKDVLRYAKIMFPSVFSNDPSEGGVITVAEKLLKDYQTEKENILLQNNHNYKENEIKECAWIGVLQKKTDDELKQLLDLKLLETEDIEHLLLLSENENENKNNNHHNAWWSTLEEKLNTLLQLRYAYPLHQTIHAVHVSKSELPADIATIIEKVKKNEMEFISEKELKQLEAYEEGIVKLKINKNENNNNNNNEMEVTHKLIDQALSPSNRFLYELSKKDEKVKKSLDQLEKIKRNSFLDDQFQKALKISHFLEEESVKPFVRGTSTSKSSSPVKVRPVRPHSAVDLPYFYHNKQFSAIAPKGDYALPAPKLKKEQYLRQRRQRKRERGPTRFSK